MNFLNPTLLFGLAAAAIPILIHLFFRRRARDEAFPSIRLLEKIKTDRIRRLRIKQLLVLILRTLIIIFIILAFARPALRSVFHRNARTAAAVVIDCSASMQYIHDGELLFNRALRKAGEIIGMLEHDDQAALILSAGESRVLGSGMTAGKEKLVKAMDTVELSFSEGSPASALNMAVDLLNSSGATNRELYYITDGAMNACPDSINASAGKVRLYNVLIGPEEREGAVLDDIELVDRLVTAGESVTFRVGGFAGEGEEEVNVEFFVNGERKSRTRAEKRSAGRIAADFAYTPETPGWYSVYAVVGDGRFGAGEIRRIVMHVPQRENVLIVGGSQNDIYFLQKALDADTGGSMFDVRAVLADELTADSVTLAGVIVLSGVQSLAGPLYHSIRNAVVERGAGLIVFPAVRMDSSLYENGIFRDFFPARIGKRITFDEKKGGEYAVIDRFDMNHPVLRGVSKDGNFLKPEVRSYLVMRPEETVSVIARFSDGSMAAGDSPCGKGRVVVFGVDATSAAGELPVTGIFVPLFIRSVQYLSGTFVTGGSYFCGETVTENIGAVQQSSTVTVKPEDGPARSVQVNYTLNGTEIQGMKAWKPGFYSVFTEEKERNRFSVDISRSEIIFQRAGEMAMNDAFENIKWKVIDDENIEESVISDRYGTELFSMFLALAFITIVLEMSISRKL